MITCFDTIYERDRQKTDGQTDTTADDTGRAYARRRTAKTTRRRLVRELPDSPYHSSLREFPKTSHCNPRDFRPE